MSTRPDHPVVARFKAGELPQAAKLSAARGLLPIPAEDLLDLVVFLTADPDPEVSRAAARTLTEYPQEQIVPVLGADTAPESVLAYYARSPRSDVMSEAILLNPATPDDAIEYLASLASPHLLDILIRNEVRLIRHPTILDRIAENPRASPAVKSRAAEIRTDFIAKGISVTPEIAAPAAPVAAPVVEEEVEEEAPDYGGLEQQALIEEVLQAPASEEVLEALDAERVDEADPTGKKKTLEQKLLKMSVPNKIKLAYMGGRQSRMILIKDPNRTVSNAVLNGGKISVQEIELVVQFRTIDDDLLRRISTIKQFTKSYNVCHNLVKNPRTPIGVAMGLVSRLNGADLKRLENNTNVSGHIREAAKRLIRMAQEAKKK
ncbi:MAG: hypothetical protein U0166_14110 [Acidobacteriota bacterium]